MRPGLTALPLQEFAFINPLCDKNMGAYPLSCGICEEHHQRRYHFNNTERSMQNGRWALLQYTLAGTGRFENLASGITYELSPGQAFLITSPGPTRYWLPKGHTWSFAYMLYAGDMALWQTERIIETGGHIVEFPADGAVGEALLSLFLLGSGADGCRASAALYRLLMELRRQQAAAAQTELPPAMEKALQMIEQHYAETSFGAETLARACGYSRCHFSRQFRRYTGSSPQDCIIATRLRQAMLRLSNSNLPVKRIAAECGFSDSSYFCRMFFRHYGINPGALRR